uniref:Uncharacterized protein n=1 Tax=Anguilla anguilla TaxID=7936 RepID=A0A0E9S339_ANGAN
MHWLPVARCLLSSLHICIKYVTEAFFTLQPARTKKTPD